GVDEARDDDLVGRVDDLGAGLRLPEGGGDGGDLAVAHEDVADQVTDLRVDRDDRSAADEDVAHFAPPSLPRNHAATIPSNGASSNAVSSWPTPARRTRVLSRPARASASWRMALCTGATILSLSPVTSSIGGASLRFQRAGLAAANSAGPASSPR